MRNLLLISLFSVSIAQAQDNTSELIINEFMQSNIDCIYDEATKEFPDSWVELYNPGDTPLNLKEYKIAKKANPENAWQLPDKQIAAHGYVVIYCDKEESGIHTDFRLETGKDCEIYLYKGEELADQMKQGLKKQPAPNIAYGRKTDGGEEWGYELTPTPGKANTGDICERDHILGDVVFSELGRVTSNKTAISLKLSLPEGAPEGAYITYTTNGSEPTATSTKYTKAINIDKSTAIRATAFCKGWLSPRSTVQSYIFHERSMTIPVVSIVTNDKYLNDSKMGIFANNQQAKVKNNWRRPVNFEYYTEEGEKSVANLLCETRIQGGQSRENKLKSMAFYAHKRFGTKSFNYEFFPDQKPGLSDYHSISLRNGGNDFSDMFFRDAIIQRTMGQHADLDWQACRSAVIYINGEYKGMLNVRERANEDNVYTNYDGLEDVDVIEISQENSKVKEELKEGTWDNYNAFKVFYNETGHTKAEYEQWIDCKEFLNLMIMNLYYGNLDFPGNNLVFWRPNKEDSGLPMVWRGIAKDTDFGLGLYGRQNNYNTIEWIYNPNFDSSNAWANTTEATMLFRHMLEDRELFDMFIDQCCVYMGDFMNEKGTSATMDLILNEVLEEFAAHREKMSGGGGGGWPWGGGGWGWQTDYKSDITNKFNTAKSWVKGRTNNFYKFIGNYKFPILKNSANTSLGTPFDLTINKNLSEAAETKLTINGIELTDVAEGVFVGKYFANRPLTISVDVPSGKVITGWKVKTTPNSGSAQTKEYEGSVLNLTTTACKTLAIEAIIGAETGIDATYATRSWTWKRTNDGIVVTGATEGTSISLHDLRGITRQTEVATGSDVILPAEKGKMYLLKVGGETIKIQ